MSEPIGKKWDDPEYRRAYFREYARKNAEKAKERSRVWYQENHERARAKRKEWYENNKDKMREYNHQYRAQNAEALRARDRARNATEERREYSRLWARAHAELNRSKVKAWREANPERAAENKRKAQRQRAKRIAAASSGPVDYAAVRDRCGNLCGICGKPVAPDEFSFDHIIPLSKGGAHSAENIQVAHIECNRLKAARLDYEPEPFPV